MARDAKTWRFSDAAIVIDYAGGDLVSSAEIWLLRFELGQVFQLVQPKRLGMAAIANDQFDQLFGADYNEVLADAQSVCRKLGISEEPHELVSDVATRFIKNGGMVTDSAIECSVAYRRKCLLNAGLDRIRARSQRSQYGRVPSDEWEIEGAKASVPTAEAVVDALEVVEVLLRRLSPNASVWLRMFLNGISASDYARHMGMNVRTAQRHFSSGLSEIREQLTDVIVDIYGFEAWEQFCRDLNLATTNFIPDFADL